MRAVLPVQKGDGDLQVLSRRVLPRRLPVHLRRQILPCSFPADRRTQLSVYPPSARRSQASLTNPEILVE
ncbi:hypothetical protein BHE74_00049752 [Ensete ventricosum]|uniref:Uncharacterized protein n=1 Tax=Ensete ventricosum TaxID=4639 RepID=A0A444CCM2_ENSVE|nr:hypothetical protein B296_00031495 [Ensete ventricosum]RWV83616.1 hypothetical protein GW17_00054751 [Ensete ventricosum]RWW44476.1 hypothetical protein BHE74_00049752 [Ensete ventricosum]RZS27442.1 hypothetical protein BHM03_00060903 [Ensete ventricosum]